MKKKMYEPVTIMSPKYASAFDHDEFANKPPEKPPRKHKLKKQQSNKETSEESKMKNEACVDVDHVSLEANNYKNKHTNASVQTSPLIPYRLRFWPRSTCDLKCAPDETGCTKVRVTCCCRVLSQWLLSQVGLTVVVVAWALLGALAFYKTEGPRELEQSEHLAKLQNDLSVELATELKQTDQHKKVWTSTIQKYLQKHKVLLLDAVHAGFGEGGGGRIWTYPGCILFAVSLLTTLGFGAPVPRTCLGRGAAVLFSAIGIPLHFLLIFNMGNLGAVKLQQLACSSTDVPASARPRWLTWFPLFSIALYYAAGVVLFGVARRRPAVDCFMFPLDFTAAGGVAATDGHLRILYGLYLELAVTLAALVLSLIQASATRGIVDIGLRLGLLTNT